MKEIISPSVIFSEKNCRDVSANRKKRSRWFRALYVSSFGGIFVGLTGLLTSGLGLFGVFEKTPIFKLIGTWMIIIAFPMVMFGAHAMDKIAEIEKNEKRKMFEEKQKQELYSPEKWKD